ncbi:agamous-like MADS-box protein AGL29 [Solanum dulcamara]|uniref:agamous-like MADS-box protein AGL29 n=1 Tax=Solanum dulcamara TaxID=45834 RepID=UPI00248688CB|nr:agamous-like MADS-box protein AGL29 [Solanum dulcamara]
MDGKRTAGRQKIPLEKIENETNRKVSFSKRRSTLYKNASEIIRDCNVDLGIVLSSPSGKPCAFVHPTTDVVIDQFVDPILELDLGSKLVAKAARDNAIQNNISLNELDATKKVVEEKISSLDQMNEAGDECWWESIDRFNAENITNFENLLNSAEDFINGQLKKPENGASSSLHPPQENADN